MHIVTLRYLGFLILVFAPIAACTQTEQPSTLGFAAFTQLGQACADRANKGVGTQTVLAFRGRLIVTQDADPCGRKKALGLNEPGRGELVIVAAPEYKSDPAIAADAEYLAKAFRDAGQQVVHVPNYTPGALDSGIQQFAKENPGFTPDRVVVAAISHGAPMETDIPDFQTRSGGPSAPDMVTSDTFLGTESANGSGGYSVLNMADEATSSLMSNGLMDQNTTCILYTSACHSGSSVNGIGTFSEHWKARGIDAAIGSSAADQVSWGSNGSLGPQGTELSVSRLAQLATSPEAFQQFDVNGDGQMSVSEFKGPNQGLIGETWQRTSIGMEIAPSGVYSQQAVANQQIGVDPNTNEPIYQNTQANFQNITTSGDQEAILFSRPELSRNPETALPQNSVPEVNSGASSASGDTLQGGSATP